MLSHKKTETLDPEDWQPMKQLAQQMAQDMITYQENIRENPILKPIDEATAAYFNQKVPQTPQTPEKVYQEFQEHFLKHKGSLIAHPRAWGGVAGQGTALGALADMWSAGMNAQVNSAHLVINQDNPTKGIRLYQVTIILYHARHILPPLKQQNIPQKQRLPQTQTRIKNQHPTTNLPNKTNKIHPMRMRQITTPKITRAQKDTDKKTHNHPNQTPAYEA